MDSFCNYFFEEMITQAVLTNTGAGIARGSVASAILIGETIDLLPLTVPNFFLHMPHGFVSSDRSFTSPTPLTLCAYNQFLHFFRIKLTIQCSLTDTTLCRRSFLCTRHCRVYKISLQTAVYYSIGSFHT